MCMAQLSAQKAEGSDWRKLQEYSVRSFGQRIKNGCDLLVLDIRSLGWGREYRLLLYSVGSAGEDGGDPGTC